MRTLILEGKQVYEDGQLKGPLQLEEGQRAGPFVILENCSSPLKVVSPTESELKETVIFENGRKEKHLLVLEGRFQMADVENANGRIYPRAIWDKVFENSDLIKGVDRGEMLGERDHPKDGETRLERVAGKVTKLWRNPDNANEVMGRFAVFDNDIGRSLKAVHDGGGRLGVSSRGKGSVVRLGGKDVVQEDYSLQTWDVVHGPSTPGAYPEEVTESNENRKGSADMSKDKEAAGSPGLVEINGKKYKLVEAEDQSKVEPKKESAKDEPIMEPGFVKTPADEEKWAKAKEAAKKSSPDDFYALANHIFHKMKGESMQEAGEYEVAYHIPGKGGWNRKNFPSDEARKKFIQKLTDEEGDDVEFRLRDPEKTGSVQEANDGPDADWSKSWIGKKWPNNDKLRDAFTSGWQAGKEQKVWRDPPRGTDPILKIAHSLGQQFALGLWKESKDRPTTMDGVKDAMRILDPEPVKDVQEALKSLRSLYRETFKVEGPLSKAEIDGINEAAKELIEMAKKLDEVCPVIRVWVGNHTLDEVKDVVEARTEGELRKKVQEIVEKASGPVVINIDRSEKIFAESASRFSELLETQTLKAEQAVRSKATSQATISELSAKLDGAKKLIEAFAVKCGALETENKALLAEVDAACKILDEMPKEVKAEGIRGAASVVAASNPSKDITEALVSAGSINEVVSLSRKITESNLPKINREPTHETKVTEAIEQDAELQKTLMEKAKESNPRNSASRRDKDLMTKVVQSVKARGGK